MFNWIFGWGSRDIESPSIKKAGDDAETLIERVSKIHDLISKRKDLRPCKEVNELFSELVEICIRTLPKATTKKVRSSTARVCPIVDGETDSPQSKYHRHYIVAENSLLDF